MPDKAPDFFQGQDWLTHRWPVAQAFDTLDRMRDLCGESVSPKLYTLAGNAPRYESRYDLPEGERIDILGGIMELCDDLSCDLDAVYADLIMHLQKDANHRWMSLEMRFYLTEMRRLVLEHCQAPRPGQQKAEAEDEILGTLMELVEAIRHRLKQIDA